jgi:hypothetical protein
VRSRGLGLLTLVALLGLSACGGGGSGTGSAQAPASHAERAAIGEYRYCVEGAGAKTAKPGESIPGLGDTPSGPDVSGARRDLVVYWTASGDLAHVYYAEDDATAQAAAEELGSGVHQKGRLVVVPDSDHPPTPDDEGLLLEDCLL